MNIFETIHYWFHDKVNYSDQGHELLYIPFKLVLGFIVLMIVSRLLGKKALQQFTPFDFIFIVILTDLLGDTVYHPDTTWFEFILATLTWCALSLLIEKTVQKFEKTRPTIKGNPVFLMEKGEINERTLAQNHMEMEQLRHALRSQGVFSLFEVDYAVLETNGQINVIRKSEGKEFPVMVIEDGKMVDEEISGIPETIVLNDLHIHRLELNQVYYAEKIGHTFHYKLKGGGDNAEQSNTETN